MKKYKTIIVDNRLDKLEEDLEYINENLCENGNLFYIMNTEYDSNGNVNMDCFDVLNIFTESKYYYKNILVYPTQNYQDVSFKDNVSYIIWLTKSNRENLFNKDPIREEHIWKNVEWGKRSKNYHSKGKDPGNVWIPTEDDGKGNITKHILLTKDNILKRLIDMSECHEDYIILENNSENTTIEKTKNNIERKKDINKKNIKENTVYFGTSENMECLEDGSINQAITSPPYWNLKNYFKEGQIGQESYEEYLSRLGDVFSETYKKLKDDGSLWININLRRRQGKVILNPGDIVDLCKSIGYFYKGIIIWHKSSGIPVGDSNLVDRYEVVFIFSKGEDFKMKSEFMDSMDDYKNEIITGKSFWNINRKAGSVGKGYEHPAIFPKELVKRIILLGSEKKEAILDPFLGSGTTLISALENNRYCLGYEYNEDFKELIEHRFEKEDLSKKINEIKYVYLNK